MLKICAVQFPKTVLQENISTLCADLSHMACGQGARLIVFPELCLAGSFTQEDLLAESTLDTITDTLKDLIAQTATLPCVLVAGLPVCHAGKLYNCAAVIQGGMLLGLVPKTYIPRNNQNTYFTPPPSANLTYEFMGSYLQLGTKQIFVDTSNPTFTFCVEVGEDALAMIPPSTYATMAGATVVCHMTDTPIDDMAYPMMAAHSRRTVSACVSVPTTGDVWIGQNGERLDPITGEVDLAMLARCRRGRWTFENHTAGEYTEVYFSLDSIEDTDNNEEFTFTEDELI